MLRKEVARLRSLASGAAYDLRNAGEERKANTGCCGPSKAGRRAGQALSRASIGQWIGQ